MIGISKITLFSLVEIGVYFFWFLALRVPLETNFRRSMWILPKDRDKYMVTSPQALEMKVFNFWC